jgi:hypothetical protein
MGISGLKSLKRIGSNVTFWPVKATSGLWAKRMGRFIRSVFRTTSTYKKKYFDYTGGGINNIQIM